MGSVLIFRGVPQWAPHSHDTGYGNPAKSQPGDNGLVGCDSAREAVFDHCWFEHSQIHHAAVEAVKKFEIDHDYHSTSEPRSGSDRLKLGADSACDDRDPFQFWRHFSR